MPTDLPPALAQFFDREARELDADSEEEEFEEEESGFLDDTALVSARNIPARPVLTDNVPQQAPEEIAQDIEQRYRKRARFGPLEYDDVEQTHPALVSFPLKTRFPPEAGVDDSHYCLYMLRTVSGKEISTANVLRRSLPKTCLAFAIDSLPCRVYIWAPDELTIAKSYRERGVENPPKLTFIPPTDVEAVFTLREGGDLALYKVGNWVKIRRGTYRGDYAIVREVLPGDGLRLAVVPRIRAKNSALSERPPPKLALPEDLQVEFPDEQISQHSPNSFVFRGARYVDGLQLLTISSVHFVRPASPSLPDIFTFSIASLGDLEHVEFYVCKGDIVVVISGPFQRLTGEVAFVDDKFIVLGRACWLGEEFQSWNGKSDFSDLNNLVQRLEVRDKLSKGAGVLTSISVSRQDVRRIFHSGDVVLVKAGPLAGTLGFVVWVKGDQELVLLVNDTDDLVSVRSTCVEITSSLVNGIEFNQDRTVGIGRGSLVETKGIVGVVLQVDADHVLLQLTNVNKTLSVLKAEVKLVELSTADCEEKEIVLDLLKSLEVYMRERRSSFVGAYVYIHGNLGLAKHKKGRFGYVRSVDVQTNTARVAYDNTEDTFGLQSLISVDRTVSLDPDHPLPRHLKAQYASMFEPLRKVTHNDRPSTPPPESELPVSISPWEAPSYEQSDSSFPVTDFSGPGMWVFLDSIQSLLSGYKIYLVDGTRKRTGILVAKSPFGDHFLCRGFHNRCRVEVDIDDGHGVITRSLREVNTLSVKPPKRKGDLVVQIRSHDQDHVGKILSVAGVPKHFTGAKKIAVGVPGDKSSRRELEETWFTKVEAIAR